MATPRTHIVAVLAAALTGVAAPARAAEFPVGHTVRQLTVPGTAQGEPRAVDVHLWYPAAAADAAARPKAVYSSVLRGRSLGTDLWSPLTWTVDAEIAREGAVIDPAGAPFSVIVFSHGNTNDPIDYAHTLELIAAAGFIVAAPGHTNNMQDDARIDYVNDLAVAAGRPRPLTCRDGLAGPCSRLDVPISMADRQKDISAVLDAIPGWFGTRADLAKVGVLGHSRGTVSALAAAGGSAAPIAGSPCQANQPRCWPLDRDPRIQAVMGMAIGQLPITLGVNFKGVTVPTLLVSGALDLMSPPAVSLRAYNEISSPDKTLISLPNGVHRSFDSTYCDQVLAAGTIAKADPKAILDRHTFDRIVTSPNSGWAPDYCAFASFTGITDLVNAATGLTVTAANVPRTGLDTDAVKTQMVALAVPFFTSRLARAAGGGVGGTVPATLALTVGGPASFGAFVAGVDREYVATTAANVVSTAGDATLSVSDPGRLANGTFALAEPLRVELSQAGWTAPVSNAAVTITFRQHIAATQALRTGAYSRNLTFTLSTTTP
jgi:predicted dienelactone hydrolase